MKKVSKKIILLICVLTFALLTGCACSDEKFQELQDTYTAYEQALEELKITYTTPGYIQKETIDATLAKAAIFKTKIEGLEQKSMTDEDADEIIAEIMTNAEDLAVANSMLEFSEELEYEIFLNGPCSDETYELIQEKYKETYKNYADINSMYIARGKYIKAMELALSKGEEYLNLYGSYSQDDLLEYEGQEVYETLEQLNDLLVETFRAN